MASIGKKTPPVTRVKSEFTLTGSKGYRPGTPSPVTPGDTRVPLTKSPITPVTVLHRRNGIPRRKSTVGDAKSQLGFGTPKIKDVVFKEATERKNVCSCDPELKSDKHPNVTFMNICSERTFNWKRFAPLLRVITLGLFALVVTFMVCYATINAISWLQHQVKITADQDLIFTEEELEEETQNDIIDINPKSFSLTESKHTLSYGDILSMALAGLFRWIINILIPLEG